jgi:hypothetical protein
MSKIVSRKLSVHKEHELLLRLETAGLGNVEAQTLIESKDNELAEKVVAYIRRGGYEIPTSFKRAVAIMGKNFISPVHVAEHFGVDYGKDIGSLWDIPYTEGVLKKCKDTHILFAGYPLTIMEIRSRVPISLFPSSDNDWYKKYAFARADKVKLRWYLMRKDIVPNSTSKTITEQTIMLSRYEEVPRTCEVVYMTILAYLVYGECLFEGIYVRCRDITKDGGRVCVLGFSGGGVGLEGFGNAYFIVGGSASRKISD